MSRVSFDKEIIRCGGWEPDRDVSNDTYSDVMVELLASLISQKVLFYFNQGNFLPSHDTQLTLSNVLLVYDLRMLYKLCIVHGDTWTF